MMGKLKRPKSAYMLWLNDSREQIKSENPDLKVTKLAKKGGQLRRAVDKSVWEDKAAKAKGQYGKDLEAYKSGGDGSGGKEKEVSAYQVGEEERRHGNCFYDKIFNRSKNEVKMMDMPKRPRSAYFMWLKASREQIKSENPGLNVNELGQKCGQIWRTLDKSAWEEKAAKAKEQYDKDLEAYKDFTQKLEKLKMMAKPKRPMGSYMMWLNASRDQIKSENPGLNTIELGKKGGQIWRTLDKSVWEEKAAKAREQYDEDLEAYNAFSQVFF